MAPRLSKWALSLRFLLTIQFLISSLPAFAEGEYQEYQVQPGDTLSTILYDNFKLCPVYGKNGYIHQTILLNRNKIFAKGEVIRPGDILLVPKGNRGADGKGCYREEDLIEPSAPAADQDTTVETENTTAEPKVAQVEEEKGKIEIFGALGIFYSYALEKIGIKSTALSQFGIPSYHLGGTKYFSEHNALSFEYFRAQIFENDGVGSSEHLALEFLRTLQRNPNFKYSIGAELNTVPLVIYRPGSNRPVAILVQMTSLRLGGNWTHPLNPGYELLVSGRLHYPFSSSSEEVTVEIASPFSFSGSIGVQKEWINQLKLGLFWHGTFQSFQYSYDSGGNQLNGQHLLFISSPEIRLLYNF